MSHPAPLPIRIKVAGEESMDLAAIRDVTTRVEGLLHLEEGQLLLEWIISTKVEEVRLLSVTQERETSEPQFAELPLDALVSITLAGGILAPHLLLRARSLRLFDGIPGAKGAELAVHYARRDRLHAVAMLHAIDAALQAAGEGP